ncbi:hypothetical protein MUK42_08338, partial [Musa troglodytarum]
KKEAIDGDVVTTRSWKATCDHYIPGRTEHCFVLRTIALPSLWFYFLSGHHGEDVLRCRRQRKWWHGLAERPRRGHHHVGGDGYLQPAAASMCCSHRLFLSRLLRDSNSHAVRLLACCERSHCSIVLISTVG